MKNFQIILMNMTQNNIWLFGYFKINKIDNICPSRKCFTKMIASYFHKSNHVGTVVLQDCKTKKDNLYMIISLLEIIAILRKFKSSMSHISLLQCKHFQQPVIWSKKTFISWIIVMLCTDLAPNDFFLYPFMKNKMHGY